MLKELLSIWRKQSVMTKVVDQFCEMLKDGEFAFSHAWKTLEGHLALDEVKQSIHDKDQQVNQDEQEIRRKLLEHLSMNPGEDVSGCLVMMSLIKDAERIGDYAKNILELKQKLGDSAPNMKYFEQLSKIQGQIEGNLIQLAQTFGDQDEQIAKQILEAYGPIKASCNEILEALFQDELSTKEAVATALLVRFLKRINSHVCNIASGLVYPLDEIDFVRDDIRS